MSKYDEAVDNFIIAKFMMNEGSYQWNARSDNARRYNPLADGHVMDISVVKADMGWECGCYSSWTRDDMFEITALLKTKTREVEFAYGNWGGFPDMIMELDEYVNNTACHYESDEYDW